MELILIVDLELLRGQAFNFLSRFPEYSANVIALIEEIEKERDRVFALQSLREQDKIIIDGLVADLIVADALGQSIENFIDADGDEVEVYKALQVWKEIKKRIIV